MDGDLDTQITGVAALNDPVRRALYRFVVDHGEPTSRDQAAEAVGVQRTLAAFHLDKLHQAGLLDVEFRRLSGRSGPGAGRPSKLYRRADRQIDVSLPPREYDLAAHLLAEAIEASTHGGGDVRASLERVSFEFGRSLGDDVEQRAGKRASKAARRELLLATLRDHGFEPRIVAGEIVLANCPFHALAREYTDLVCGMNLHLMEGVRSVIGVDERSLQPRLDPEPGLCCVRFGDAC